MFNAAQQPPEAKNNNNVAPPDSAATIDTATAPAETEKDKIDYSGIANQVLPAVRQNSDLLRICQYFDHMNYAKEYECQDKSGYAVKMDVNFCDCSKIKTMSRSMNASRLYQQYVRDLFVNNYYDFLWTDKSKFPQGMYNRCNYCRGKSEEYSFEVCPYFLTEVIRQHCHSIGIPTSTLYKQLLDDKYIDFPAPIHASEDLPIEAEDISGIDAISAHGAYLMLLSKLIRVYEKTPDTYTYTYLYKLCRKDRTGMMSDLYYFWDLGDSTGTIPVNDKDSIIHQKDDTCTSCDFKQCPHKLAAYFVYLGDKYNTDPLKVAYYVMHNTCHERISLQSNFQHNKYIRAIETSSLTPQSKEELTNLIYYIIGRNHNSRIPFLPINLVVTSPDIAAAEELIDIFINAVWFFDYYGIQNSTNKMVYLSSVSFDELVKIYETSAKGTTIMLQDIHLLIDNPDFKSGHHNLLKIMKDRSNEILTVILAEKEDAHCFFTTYPLFKKHIFTRTLEMNNLSSSTVTEKLLEKLGEVFDIPANISDLVSHYVQASYPSSSLKGLEYVNNVYETMLFNHYNHDIHADNELRSADIPYITPPRSEASIFEEINKLVGLDNIKKELKNVHDLVRFNIKMGASSKNSVNLHMIFSGNPGTGKTTVARLTAEILHSIGFISENKLVVCSAKDIIGEYIGQTTPKTAKKCEQAYNGVLFIDEAYQLNPYTTSHPDPFKEECIAELIQQMENNRDKLVVIFAGYTDEMNDFMNKANTGLKSRIGKNLIFEDYSSDDLVEIFSRIVSNAGLTLGEGALEKARSIFEIAKQNPEKFGNARYARNLYEASLLKHAALTSTLDANDPKLKILEAAEITMPDT